MAEIFCISFLDTKALRWICESKLFEQVYTDTFRIVAVTEKPLSNAGYWQVRVPLAFCSQEKKRASTLSNLNQVLLRQQILIFRRVLHSTCKTGGAIANGKLLRSCARHLSSFCTNRSSTTARMAQWKPEQSHIQLASVVENWSRSCQFERTIFDLDMRRSKESTIIQCDN
jgi:hypothetical protein